VQQFLLYIYTLKFIVSFKVPTAAALNTACLRRSGNGTSRRYLLITPVWSRQSDPGPADGKMKATAGSKIITSSDLYNITVGWEVDPTVILYSMNETDSDIKVLLLVLKLAVIDTESGFRLGNDR
jgi:hypothetical protein